MLNPFNPLEAATVNIPATVASGRVQVRVAPEPGPSQVRIYNAGPGTAFVRAGTDATVVASAANDMPIPAGDVEVRTVWSVDSNGVWLAAITASGTATVYFTPGRGI